MNTSNQKIDITVYFRENCLVSREVLQTISECEKIEDKINLSLIDLDKSEKPRGIFISPTIVVEGRVWAIGAHDHQKLVHHILGNVDIAC